MNKLVIAFPFVAGLGLTIAFGDDIFPEEAPWFGKTGLSPDVEREMPRYLRRELGEPFFLPKSLNASDLTYIGAFSGGAERVHYWKIPYGDQDIYSHVVIIGPHQSLGWGGRKPATAMK